MRAVVLAALRQIILICVGALRLGCDRHVALGARIGDLHIVGQQVLREQPGGQNLLRIVLVEDADRRTLGDHLRMSGIKLRNRHDLNVKIHQLVFADIDQRRVGTHPGRAGCRVHRKDALPGVQKIRRIAGDLERRERAALCVLCNGAQQRPGCVVEDFNFTVIGRIAGALLPQHLDHHVVSGFIDEGNHHLLPVDEEVSIVILGHGGFRNRPDEIPRQRLGQREAQRFHIGSVDIAGFR